jgi:hypothetical protein
MPVDLGGLEKKTKAFLNRFFGVIKKKSLSNFSINNFFINVNDFISYPCRFSLSPLVNFYQAGDGFGRQA